MLRKLKRKFTAINMILVALVLIVAFSTVLVINARQQEAEVYSALDAATVSNAKLDIDFGLFDNGAHANSNSTGTTSTGTTSTGTTSTGTTSTGSSAWSNTTNSSSSSAASSSSSSTGTAPSTNTGGGPHQQSDNGHLIAMASYSVDGSGNVTETLIDSYTMDSTTQASAIAEALAKGNGTGKLDDLKLYYQVKTSSSGTRVAFIPTSYVTSSTLSLAGTLSIIGGAALVAFFFISLFLARWAMKPVERTWSQQQQFVADANHELKTPLTVIMANNSILMAHPQDTVESQMQWIESTETEAHLMQGLVGDLLFLAKPEDQQQTKLLTEPVDFSDLVESNVLQFESVAFEKEIDLDSQVQDGITINGSKQRLQRLVGVLIDNACKYAEEGGKVRVSLKRSGGHVVFAVNNSGTTISAEELPHIFDRFWRADKARVREKGGFGLGLAIAKEVVDEHHGTIAATSEEKEGTTFIVTF